MPTIQHQSDNWRTRTFWLPAGDAGVVKTINQMEGLVSGPQGQGSALLRQAVLTAVRGSVRNITEIQAWFDWVKRNIEFRGEAEETLQSPEATLTFGAGDCDDHAMLLAAGLKSLGYKTAFKTVGVSGEAPEEFTHVYAMVQDKLTGQWIPLDSTVGISYPGWEPDDITREHMYKLNGYPMHHGFGFYKPGNFRGLRGLGDAYDPTVAITDVAAPVPIPLATGGFDANQAWLYNLTVPFAQAGASLLAHGQTPAVQPSSLNASPLIWIIGLALVGGVLFVAARR